MSSLMRKFFYSLIAIMLLPTMAQSAGYLHMKQIEDAVETKEFNLQLNLDRTGTITAVGCADCAPREFIITAETKAFSADKPTDIHNLLTVRDQQVVIFFNAETQQVTRIKW